MKIKSALISVFNKDGIDDLATYLAKNNVKLYSTGGTQKYLESIGLEVEAVEDYTKYPSVFGGRVKTLHPAIFGGILYRRDNESDLEELAKHNIPNLDLIIVDLYPFEDTVKSGASHTDIIEKIDIGGISLIRAAAKNYKFTSIISDQSQYSLVLNHLKENEGSTTLKFREELAVAAFQKSHHYDGAIHGYLNQEEVVALRYGENPHQNASFRGKIDQIFNKLSGKELSYNNLLDIDAAVLLMKDISEKETCSFAILKHNNACGCAQRDTVAEAFDAALEADPVSAFGGIFITDSEIDLATAQRIDKIFYEVCIAPSYSEEALSLLKAKAKRVLLAWNIESPLNQTTERSVLNGKLMQEADNKNVAKEDLSWPTKLKATTKQLEDLLFADKLVKNTKSNAIVLVKDKQLLASGTGQTSRVDALRQAINKAKSFKLGLNGAVMASDAFFPFPDCVEIAGEEKIAAIIQPGGSIKDNLSIEAADSLGIAMAHTGVRHFKH
jgi:phosphoribosylaminoimidazolecarboxamide formyltransferase/IMP cyclohydrolase